MNHQLSRRSLIAVGAGALAATGSISPMCAVAESAEGRWESEVFGDEVTWDLHHMHFRPELSDEDGAGEVKWADCYFGVGLEGKSVALVMVRFQELEYANLEEFADAFPDDFWSEASLKRNIVRHTKLTDDAFGVFYIDDPELPLGGNWCSYLEVVPPATEDGAWSQYLLTAGIKTGAFDLDVLAEDGNGLKINGQPTYRAFSFDEVMDAFTAEWEERGLK